MTLLLGVFSASRAHSENRFATVQRQCVSASVPVGDSTALSHHPVTWGTPAARLGPPLLHMGTGVSSRTRTRLAWTTGPRLGCRLLVAVGLSGLGYERLVTAVSSTYQKQ